MPAINNMPRDYKAIAEVLAGEYALANTMQVKSALWCATLSIADKMLQAEPTNFNRSDFYFIVFGTRDHFEARDKFTRQWANENETPEPRLWTLPTNLTPGDTGGI